MDPLSQAVLGASLPVALSRKKEAKTALICGALAGMLPDLDVLISSSTDPLLSLEYHRQFTHSLLFIPFGGLIAALSFKYLLRMKTSFQRLYWYSTLGYATHGLLDACTTYGTQLFWPFSNTRIAWNTVSIIDPLFTLPILILLFLYSKKTSIFRCTAFLFAILYLSLGFLQNHRVLNVATQLAKTRQHNGHNFQAYPTLGNLLLWRSVYEFDNKFQVDAVRAGFSTKVYPGSHVEKLDLKRDFPQLDPQSTQAKDISRFQWFTNQHAYKIPDEPLIGDVRYSMCPSSTIPMWGITIDVNQSQKHVNFSRTAKSVERPISKLVDMLLGKTLTNSE